MSEQHAEQHAQQPEVPASGPWIIAVSNELVELKQKVNQLLQLMTGSKAKSPSTHVTESIDIDMSDDDDNDELDSGDDSHLIAQQLKGKKRAQDDETLEDTQPCVRRRLDKAPEPKLPLPDPSGGNPKNLKKFLNSLDLCFPGAPYKYGREESKIVMAGLICTHSKVFPRRETWQD